MTPRHAFAADAMERCGRLGHVRVAVTVAGRGWVECARCGEELLGMVPPLPPPRRVPEPPEAPRMAPPPPPAPVAVELPKTQPGPAGKRPRRRPQEHAARNAEIAKLRAGGGMRAQELAARFGLSLQSIWGILHEAKHPRPVAKAPPCHKERDAAIVAARAAGADVLCLAADYGISWQTVYRVLRKARKNGV